MNKLGGRKFAATFSVIALGVGVDLFAPNGLSTNLMTLLSIALGLYSGANVFKAWKAPVAGAMQQAPKAEPQDLTPLLEAITGLQESQRATNNRIALISEKVL